VDGNNETVFFFNSSDQLELYNYQAGSFNARKASSAVFRDPSAWYHIVVAWDTANATAADRVRLYVNGSRITSFSNSIDPAQNTTSAGINVNRSHRIGSRDNTVNYLLNGYLADVFFVDAQGLDPSSFTEVSATTGQLIPKAYTGTFTGNSFWLKFADNSAATATTLGKDSSGLGNNWTPNNLSVTNGNGSYVSGISGSLDLVNGGPASSAFDGSISTGVYPNPGSSATWTAPSSAAFTSSARIYVQVDANGDAGGVVVNSNTISTGLTGASGWVNITSAGSPISTITWSRLSSGSQGVTLKAVEIDGEILIDNTFSSGNDSLVDTPVSGSQVDTGLGGQVTGNYATWNPLISSTNLTNGNLSVVQPSTTGASRYSTIGMSTGKWYWEISVVKYSNTVFGIRTPGGGILETPYDSSGYGMGWRTAGGFFIGGSNTGTGSMSLAAGDILGLAFDADAGTLRFYKNGTLNNTLTASSTYIGQTWFAGSQDSSGGNSDHDVNFGQRAWAYTAPTNYRPLVDTLLPAPVVAKPSTAMDVKLYTGNGSTQTISGLNFSPDFIWTKSRSRVDNNVLHDIVRGRTSNLYSDLAASENTTTLSTADLVSFDANGYTLGTVQQSAMNRSGETYVAWAWDAGSTTVTNTQGSITSQVRANASAGFSIITATQPVTANLGCTVGHGLGVAPSMYIVKDRDLSINWGVYHSGLSSPATQALQLSTTSAAFTATNYWKSTSPTSSVLSIGTSIVGEGNDFVVYAFAPVAGYSSMGSFSANGTTDNAFVFCGFRPRYIIAKQTDGAGGNWFIADTARDPYNVQANLLDANLSNAERTANIYDILSNGFKIRYGLSGTFVYCAFAESPFNYARAR